MWELETIGRGRHIMRIGEDATSINGLLKVILVLTSLCEAIILPVLVSLTWIAIYKFKQNMNGSDFKMCMEATHGSFGKLFIDSFLRYKNLSKGMLLFSILLFVATLLGKNIPNIMLSGIIELHEFTEIVPSNIVLFKNDANTDCIYKACTSDSTKEGFALVVNSTTILNTLNGNNVQKTYWDSNNSNNTLYAVRLKIDTASCVLGIGFSNGVLSSDNLGNVTDTLTNSGRFTGSYSNHDPSPRNVDITSFGLRSELTITMTDRCDIPLNLFYVSPDFPPDVVKLAKWLHDSGYVHEQKFDRTCEVRMRCMIDLEWKQMQIFGNTPDDLKISDAQYNNTREKLSELIAKNVLDTDLNGKWYGERLINNEMDKMSSMLTTWRNVMRFQGSKYNYNILDQFGNSFSETFASSIQSMMNNVSVDVDMKQISVAPGLWIEITVVTFTLLLVCVMSMTILTVRNPKMLLPLSVLDFGIISNSIFKEYDSDGSLNKKHSWPFGMVHLDDKSYHLTTANELIDK